MSNTGHKNTAVDEAIVIAKHLVARREMQVQRHGDLFVEELDFARRRLERARAGLVKRPPYGFALEAWNDNVRAAVELGYTAE